MEENAEQVVLTQEDAPKVKAKREISTIAFPYSDLADVVELAQAIWDNVGTSTADQAQLAAWGGHDSVDSGTYRTRLSAARVFGLITSGSRQVGLTDLGRAIVDPDRAAQARVESFLTVPLYRKLFERYEGRTLPTTNIALEADLVDIGVAEKQKDRARQVFQRSAEQAGFFAQGRSRLVRPAFRQTENNGNGDQDEHHGGGGDGGGPDLDPMVKLLVGSLPKPGTIWPKSERTKWIALANAAFDVVYKEATPSTSAPSQPPSQSHSDVQD